MEELVTYKDQESTPFDLGPIIGMGGQCVVYKARKEDSKPRQYPYAQKTMTIEPEAGAVEAAKREFIEEVKILRHAQHIHVTKFIDAFEIKQDKPQLAFVMRAAKGDINDFLMGKRTKPDQLRLMREWFYCLAGAVDYIHGLGIRHRDIKPKNILVGDKGEALLADFGISRMGIVQTLSTTVPQWARSRTSSHCAPEVENGSSRGRSADIFSLGCIFLELLLACYDRDRISSLAEEVTDKVTREKSYAKHVEKLGDWIRSFEEASNAKLGVLGCGILSLCQKMLQEDRDGRPQAFEVLEKLQRLQPSSSGRRPRLCKCHEVLPLEGDAALVEACKAGSLDEVMRLISHNEAQASAIGALHQAAAHNHSSIVGYLVGDCNVPVDLQDLSKQTALHCAASSGHAEILNILLYYGAATSIVDIEGRTALHYAAGHGRSGIITILLSQRTGLFDLAIEDQDGQTALHFAAKRGHKVEVQMLLAQLPSTLEKKGYADKSDKNKHTALHFAAGYGSPEMVEALLRVNANVHAKDIRKWTALHYAARGRDAEKKCKEVCELLIERGAKVHELDKNGKTACWDANLSVLELLQNAMGLFPPADIEGGDRLTSQLPFQDRGEEKAVGNLPADFHPDFLSFITISQYHKVDIWPLPWDSRLGTLGRGATGDVRQALVDLESQFAFKRFVSHRATRLNDTESPTSFRSNEKLFIALVSELVVLSQIKIRQHEHIVDIEGIAFDVEETNEDTLEVWPLLIMKKAQHGSIMSYMASESGKAVDFFNKLKFCAQIGSAISTMHLNNIVHGDIKPQNILMYGNDQEVTAKVTDFSYSCIGKSDDDIVILPRSELWQAPEYHRGGCKVKDAKLMDIYSFGLICFWLLFPAEFDDLASTRGGLTDVQAKAERLASEKNSSELYDSQSLVKFFAITLSTDPEARKMDWKELVSLLSQELWQPIDQNNYFDGSRRLTLADYGATAKDIESPEKLQALTSRILNSLHLTGTDYDTMRAHLDSTRFTDKQRTERYINLVLEGLNKFSFQSAEKDDEVRTQLKHSCLNIPSAFYQLIILDYRVRVYVVRCLEQRANGQCEHCARSAALELAFCYTVGFGVVSDATASQNWLTRSGSNADRLRERLKYLKSLTISDTETTTHMKSGTKGLFAISYHVRYGSENLHLAELHLLREIQDLEKHLGTDHWQLFELKFELIHILWAQNRREEAAIMAEAYRISMRETYGAEHVLPLRIALLLAVLYRELNRWDDAEKVLSEAKRVLFKNLNSNHHLCLQACEALASTYAERGKNTEADEEFRQIFKVIQEYLYPHHPLASKVAQLYAIFLERQGRVKDAGDIRSQHNRGSLMSPELKRLYEEHNAGRDAKLQGDLELAENMLSKVKRDAESFVETHDTPDNSEYMKIAKMATQNLALVIRDRKRFGQAEELQRELKKNIEDEIRELDRISELEQKSLDNAMFDLARTLQMQEKWAEAEKLQHAVRTSREKLLSRTHESTVGSSRHLAEIYEGQNKLDEAENERKRVRDACMERLGPLHRDSVEATEKLAVVYLLRGKLELAEEACAEAALLYEDVLGPNDVSTLGFWSNLGLVYMNQRRLQEATELLEQTLEKMRNHLPHEHEFVKITTNHLVTAYVQQGKVEEASRLRMRIQPPGTQQEVQPRVLSDDEQT